MNKSLRMLILCVIGATCFLAAQEGPRPASSPAQAQNEQLQRIICDLDLGIPVVRANALSEIRQVGGWFAISALSRFLENDPKYGQGSYDFFGMYASPRFYALQILAQIVPDAPLGPPSGALAYDPSSKDTVWRAAVWKDWLEKNHDRLAQMKPQGEGIKSSREGCREAWKREINAIKELNGSNRFSMLQIMLARHEQPEQLQQLVCELNRGNHDVQYSAIEKLRSVGGWFSIRALSRFVEDDPKLTRATEREAHLHALRALSAVVPNPPLSERESLPQANYSAELATWKEWLQSNHDALVSLEPTGQGIIASAEVCVRALENDPANLAYRRPQGTETHR